jgi:hypothetical protein
MLTPRRRRLGMQPTLPESYPPVQVSGPVVLGVAYEWRSAIGCSSAQPLSPPGDRWSTTRQPQSTRMKLRPRPRADEPEAPTATHAPGGIA